MISLWPITIFENFDFMHYDFYVNTGKEVNLTLIFNIRDVWNIDLLLQTL